MSGRSLALVALAIVTAAPHLTARPYRVTRRKAPAVVVKTPRRPVVVRPAPVAGELLAFRRLDRSSDGALSFAELSRLTSTPAAPPARDEEPLTLRLARVMDLNQDGAVSGPEQQRGAEAVLRFLDADRDRHLAYPEYLNLYADLGWLRSALRTAPAVAAPAPARYIAMPEPLPTSRYDLDQDGRVTVEEMRAVRSADHVELGNVSAPAVAAPSPQASEAHLAAIRAEALAAEAEAATARAAAARAKAEAAALGANTY